MNALETMPMLTRLPENEMSDAKVRVLSGWGGGGGGKRGAQTGDCSLPESECQRPRSGRFLGQGGEEIERNHACAGLRVRCPKPWGGGGR